MVTKQSRILLFAVAFAVLVLVPPFLSIRFPPYPLAHWADVLDLATPLVLIPLYWVLFTDAGRVQRMILPALAFMALAALWTEGQGMHLSANSIGNLLGTGTSDVHALTHFYDEVLSHYLWHLGIIGLSVLLLVLPPGESPSGAPPRWWLIVPSGLLYGFTFFAAVNEGGTVPLGLPAALLILTWVLIRRRSDITTNNLTAFFFLAYVVAALLFAMWFARWGGFPEFSETGIL